MSKGYLRGPRRLNVSHLFGVNLRPQVDTSIGSSEWDNDKEQAHD